MRLALTIAAALFTAPVWAATPDLQRIVGHHVLPGYETLVRTTSDLAATAETDCRPDSPDLISAYHAAFDAWVAVSHLRFGPSERDDRAFALAFWPDPRGSTPKALAALVRNEDTVVEDPETFQTVSVAARGFYALEFLLFEAQFTSGAAASYQCALIGAVTSDIAATSAAIHSDWADTYAALIVDADNDTYRTANEAARQLFTAVSTGLEFTSQARLGRPLGTFDRPRPNRAEARRSGRSLRHVVLSLEATRDLASILSMQNNSLDRAFAVAIQTAHDLSDPVFAGVATPQGRVRVEVLQQRIDDIRAVLAEEVGPLLGISAGFNALDGD